MKISKEFDNKQLIKIIKKQICFCLKYRHFRSLFFVSEKKKKDVTFEYLQHFCKDSWFVRRSIGLILHNSNECSVLFKNGSIIRVVSATDNVKGHKANNIVLDSDIKDQKTINCIIRPVITNLWVKPPKLAMELLRIRPHWKRFQKVEYTVKI